MRESKRTILLLILGSFFLCNAIVAELIGVKIFSVENTLGLNPAQLTFFGNVLSFNMSAGVLLWPVVFILTDIINEYFGIKVVRLFSFVAVAMISYAFVAIFLTIKLSPTDFWLIKQTLNGPLDMQNAFTYIYSQGLWIIFGSMIAFLIGQLVDVTVFHYVKRKTGEKHLWLRATGSTIVSQFIDSFVVLFIAFYIGAGYSLKLILAIGIVNYAYKFTVAALLTPILYLIHSIIDRYLGKELSKKMLEEAAK